MKDVRSTVSQNITELRLLNNMTQLELAEKLNYSDKAISKWERGESLPDVAVLLSIADLFGVSLDRLVREENLAEQVQKIKPEKTAYNRRAIGYVSEGAVWTIAFLAFTITSLVSSTATFSWLYFVYALPISLVVKLVFNSIWFNPRHNYFIISALLWSILATIHTTFAYFQIDISLVYLLGIAGQVIIIIWSFIKKPKR